MPGFLAKSGRFLEAPWQLVRYGVVGVAVNLLLFPAYLGLTRLGMGHKTGMTLVYASGVLMSFVFNRNWTFRHRGQPPAALVRYLVAYAAGYFLNLALLWALVDRAGFPHAWVQGTLIFVIAGCIFLMQKFWVFKPA